MQSQEPLDLYETYLRDVNGMTYYVKDIREGMRQFLSDEGYRISFNIEGVVITLRRGIQAESMQRLSEFLGQVSIDCAATVRGL